MAEKLPEIKLLTVLEVAAILRVSKMTVYRLIQTGELPAKRINRRSIRVPEDAVLTYVNGSDIV